MIEKKKGGYLLDVVDDSLVSNLVAEFIFNMKNCREWTANFKELSIYHSR